MLIMVQKENEQGQIYIFIDTYFERSQIHRLTIMYHLQIMTISLIFHCEIFTISFSVRVICISNIFHI